MSSILNISRYCYNYKVTVPNCAKNLIFGFNKAFTEVIIYFTDKHFKKYAYKGTTDIYGEVTVDLSVFPPGLFNPYAGIFSVYAVQVGGTGRDRLFFRNDIGYFPGVDLSVEDIYYTNYTPASEHRVDLYNFRCCCTDIRPCDNVEIDPCDVVIEEDILDPFCRFTEEHVTIEWLNTETFEPLPEIIYSSDFTTNVILRVNVEQLECCGLDPCLISNSSDDTEAFEILSGAANFGYGFDITCGDDYTISIFTPEAVTIRWFFTVTLGICPPIEVYKDITIVKV